MSEHFSKSQIETFELCPRKWAFGYIDGIKGPPNKSAQFGIDVHKYLETWLKKREAPVGGDEARVAQAMIPFLPVPQLVRPECVEVFMDLRLSGIHFIGYLDIFLPHTPIPQIYDHKTTTSFDWALSPDEFKDDIQATLYAAWAMLKTNAEKVETIWTYALNRGAAHVLPVKGILTGKDCRPRLMKTIETAKLAQEVRATYKRAIDVPYDANGCEAYGGCPHQKLCNLTPQEKMESIMAQGSLLDRMKAEKTGGSKNGAAVNPPARPGNNALLDKLRAEKAKAPEEVVEAEAEEVVEAPKKRGRPRIAKEAAADLVVEEALAKDIAREAWMAFAKAAIPQVMVVLGEESLLADEAPELAAKIVANFSDALVAAMRTRY